MILNSNNDNTDESNTPMRYRIQISNLKMTLYSGQAEDFTNTTYPELRAIWSTATNDYMEEYHQNLLTEGIDNDARTSDVTNVVVEQTIITNANLYKFRGGTRGVNIFYNAILTYTSEMQDLAEDTRLFNDNGELQPYLEDVVNDLVVLPFVMEDSKVTFLEKLQIMANDSSDSTFYDTVGSMSAASWDGSVMTSSPTTSPTSAPTLSLEPTDMPVTSAPTVSAMPSDTPTLRHSELPSTSHQPSSAPVGDPTSTPSGNPSAPTFKPTFYFPDKPTLTPTATPTTGKPSATPTTANPTVTESMEPSEVPTVFVTSAEPTDYPLVLFTPSPTGMPITLAPAVVESAAPSVVAVALEPTVVLNETVTNNTSTDPLDLLGDLMGQLEQVNNAVNYTELDQEAQQKLDEATAAEEAMASFMSEKLVTFLAPMRLTMNMHYEIRSSATNNNGLFTDSNITRALWEETTSNFMSEFYEERNKSMVYWDVIPGIQMVASTMEGSVVEKKVARGAGRGLRNDRELVQAGMIQVIYDQQPTFMASTELTKTFTNKDMADDVATTPLTSKAQQVYEKRLQDVMGQYTASPMTITPQSVSIALGFQGSIFSDKKDDMIMLIGPFDTELAEMFFKGQWENAVVQHVESYYNVERKDAKIFDVDMLTTIFKMDIDDENNAYKITYGHHFRYSSVFDVDQLDLHNIATEPFGTFEQKTMFLNRLGETFQNREVKFVGNETEFTKYSTFGLNSLETTDTNLSPGNNTLKIVLAVIGSLAGLVLLAFGGKVFYARRIYMRSMNAETNARGKENDLYFMSDTGSSIFGSEMGMDNGKMMLDDESFGETDDMGTSKQPNIGGSGGGMSDIYSMPPLENIDRENSRNSNISNISSDEDKNSGHNVKWDYVSQGDPAQASYQRQYNDNSQSQPYSDNKRGSVSTYDSYNTDPSYNDHKRNSVGTYNSSDGSMPSMPGYPHHPNPYGVPQSYMNDRNMTPNTMDHNNPTNNNQYASNGRPMSDRIQANDFGEDDEKRSSIGSSSTMSSKGGRNASPGVNNLGLGCINEDAPLSLNHVSAQNALARQREAERKVSEGTNDDGSITSSKGKRRVSFNFDTHDDDLEGEPPQYAVS